MRRSTILAIISSIYIFFSQMWDSFFGGIFGYSDIRTGADSFLVLLSNFFILYFFLLLLRSRLAGDRQPVYLKCVIAALFIGVLQKLEGFTSVLFPSSEGLVTVVYSLQNFIPLFISVSLYMLFRSLEKDTTEELNELKTSFRLNRMAWLFMTCINTVNLLYFVTGRDLLTGITEAESLILMCSMFLSVTSVFLASVKFYIEFYRDVLLKIPSKKV